MSARPDASRSLAQLIRTAAVDQLTYAISLLAEQGPLEPAAVHETRKTVKRIRAALQLIRGELSEEFSHWDRQLREVNRSLSQARDLDMCRQTLSDLRASTSQPRRKVLERIETELSERRSEIQAGAMQEGNASSLAASLEHVRSALRDWSPQTGGFELIRPAVRKMARQARRSIRRLHKESHSEEVHSLRKIVKRRLYWLELLQPIWPRGLHAEEKLVDTLADRLGKHHDLEVLIDNLRGSALANDAALQKPVAHLIGKLQARQRKSEARALRLASYLFAERPKAFTRRWSELVKVWQDAPPEPEEAPAINNELVRARPR